MRAAISLAILLLLVPSPAAADQIAFWSYLNSNLTFGSGSAEHSGYDLVEGIGTFEASSGPLVDQTLVTDASGNVIRSEYLYAGGTFQADFTYLNNQPVTGSFVAPIISLEIDVLETQQHVFASYVLGPGLFDAPIADALGVRRRTVGGDIFSDMLFVPGAGGDFTSPERHAWDGATFVTVNVPEPPIPMLAALGFGAAWCWRRRSLQTKSPH
jgi:hypothetical protein